MHIRRSAFTHKNTVLLYVGGTLYTTLDGKKLLKATNVALQSMETIIDESFDAHVDTLVGGRSFNLSKESPPIEVKAVFKGSGREVEYSDAEVDSVVDILSKFFSPQILQKALYEQQKKVDTQ